ATEICLSPGEAFFLPRVHDHAAAPKPRARNARLSIACISTPGIRGGLESSSMHVVGTAGHVDHGKSTLITALTGIDPDRFAEEKRRGLTIDLGFAWCTLPSGREIGIVDVPGHERFIRNMLAGVGAIDAAIFVVAADEGWMPQSAEHLQILSFLGISRAV